MTLDPASGTLRASPTLDAAREQLGGRGSPDGEIGTLVHATTLPGEPLGVVLFRAGGKADLWIGDGRVRRVGEETLRDASRAEAPERLLSTAARVRDFAALQEGDAVRFEPKEGTAEEGVLIEKHRYGALVLRSDERIVAVGFRRLWAVPSSHA
jgi:hypothetical protein